MSGESLTYIEGLVPASIWIFFNFTYLFILLLSVGSDITKWIA